VTFLGLQGDAPSAMGRRAALLALLLVGDSVGTRERASLKREQFGSSKRGCPFGSHDGDVIVLLREHTAGGGRGHRRRAQALVERHLHLRHSESPANSTGEPESAAPFSLIAGLKAHLHNATLEALLDDDEVELVEADCIVHSTGTQTNPPWHLDRIDSCFGHASTCPDSLRLDSTYDHGAALAQEGVIYILDTGVRISHDDFGGRAIAGFSPKCDHQGASGCTHNGGLYAWQGVITDTVNSQISSGLCDSHGTHCASSAAGTTYGVAKGASVVTVGVLDCEGRGYMSDVIAGIEWSVDRAQRLRHVETAVISLSLGGGVSQSEDAAVAAAHDAGVLVVVAAGNDAEDACLSSPARAPKAITVGATTSQDGMSSFSNHGTCVDILAPGSDITAATTESDSATDRSWGTSMACPQAAGAAAQLRSRNPTLSTTQVTDMLLCLATSGALSGLPTGTPNKLLYAGDVFTDPFNLRAVACGFSSAVLPPFPPASPPPPPSRPGICSDTCYFAYDSDCDDGGPGAEYISCTLGSDCSDCGIRIPNEGMNCWYPCSQSGGQPCASFCGSEGACCRIGYEPSAAYCGFGALGCDSYHCCTRMPSPPPDIPSPPPLPSPPPSPRPAPPSPSPLPTPPPPPLPALLNANEECWWQCGSGGECPGHCGAQGACCRQGFDSNNAACGFGSSGCEWNHCCVLAVGQSPRSPSTPPLPPSPSPSPPSPSPPPSPLPSPPPPVPALLNANEECWWDCGSGGECPGHCGAQGACCRQGFDSNNAACGFGSSGCQSNHCCVLAAD